MDILDEVLDNLCKNTLTRKSFLDNYQQVTVVIDEMIDSGLVFNTDSENIEFRLNIKDSKQSASSEGGYFKNVMVYFIFF